MVMSKTKKKYFFQHKTGLKGFIRAYRHVVKIFKSALNIKFNSSNYVINIILI